MNKTLIKTSVATLLLTSATAVKFQYADDTTNVQVPRDSLDAIEEQEESEQSSLYPPSMSQKKKKDFTDEPVFGANNAAKSNQTSNATQAKTADQTKNATSLSHAKVEAKVDAKRADDDDNGKDLQDKAKLKAKLQKDEKAKIDARNNDKTETWNIPVVDFDQEYDHMGYTRQALLNDIDAIKIEKTNTAGADKPFCKLSDWAVVHYKAIVDGHVVEDSRTFDKGKPKVFKLGHFQVSKCWDISLQQVKQGEAASVTCPGMLDKGKAPDERTKLENWDKDTKFVPSEATVRYEFEMLECSPNPPYLMPTMYPEPMIDDECFYIISSGRWGKGSNLAFQVDEQDKYYPKNYGIYDIRLKQYEGKAANKLSQQFTYNHESKTIKSLLHPETAIFEGVNKNIVMYKNIGADNQHWDHSSSGLTWQNSNSKDFIAISEFVVDANVHTDDSYGKETEGYGWEIEYCNMEHVHSKAGVEDDHGDDHHH